MTGEEKPLRTVLALIPRLSKNEIVQVRKILDKAEAELDGHRESLTNSFSSINWAALADHAAKLDALKATGTPDNRPPPVVDITADTQKRGRPVGSPDIFYVLFGADMVLRGEAENAQEAARMVVDFCFFVRGSTPDQTIDRLGRKIRQALDVLN